MPAVREKETDSMTTTMPTDDWWVGLARLVVALSLKVNHTFEGNKLWISLSVNKSYFPGHLRLRPRCVPLAKSYDS